MRMNSADLLRHIVPQDEDWEEEEEQAVDPHLQDYIAQNEQLVEGPPLAAFVVPKKTRKTKKTKKKQPVSKIEQPKREEVIPQIIVEKQVEKQSSFSPPSTINMGFHGKISFYDTLQSIQAEDNTSEKNRIPSAKRAFAATTHHKSKIFLHGGQPVAATTASNSLSDLWSYDIKTNSWEQHNVNQLPARSHHKMAYFVDASQNHTLQMFADFGASDLMRFEIPIIDNFPVSYCTAVELPKVMSRIDFSCDTVFPRQLIMLYGGVHPITNIYCADLVFIKNLGTPKVLHPTGRSFWPRARAGHGTCIIGNKYLVIFGGKNEIKLFNDLWIFDLDLSKFVDVNVSSMVPPPIAYHSLLSMNDRQEIWCIGGETEHGPSSVIYRLVYQFRKHDILITWNIIHSHADSELIPVYKGHSVHQMHDIYILGGVNFLNQSNHGLTMLPQCMREPLGTNNLLLYLGQLFNTGEHSDLTLVLVSSKEQSLIKVHKVILEARCPELAAALDIWNHNKLLVVDLEDTEPEVYKQFLRCIYTCTMEIVGHMAIQSFLQLCKKWNFCEQLLYDLMMKPPTLQPIHSLLRQLETDFLRLFTSQKFTDFTIYNSNQEWHIHQLFMRQIPLLSQMLSSGFQEATTHRMELSQLTDRSIDAFLRYLYSSHADQVDETIAVELYMLSQQYQIPNMEIFCLELVKNDLCLENVAYVLDIAENAPALKRECLVFIRSMAEVYGSMVDTLDVSEKVKRCIREEILQMDKIRLAHESTQHLRKKNREIAMSKKRDDYLPMWRRYKRNRANQ